jgi:hypothetical protein
MLKANSAIHQKYNITHICNFKCPDSHLEKQKEMYKNLFNSICQNINTSTCNKYKDY